MKINDISTSRLNFLKVAARKLGNETKGGYVEAVSSFFHRNHIHDCDLYGKHWEVVVFFILGVFQASMKERKIRFSVWTDKGLDDAQIDLEINGHPIQLKLGQSAMGAEIVQDALAFRGITVVNAPADSCGCDIFVDMLKAAGFSEEEVDRELDENDGFNAAEEVWDWFRQGIEL